jgi:hypothetical protein
MNAWPSLVRGLRAISRKRLFVRSDPGPTRHDIEESPEAEPALEPPRARGIDTQELLELDRRLEKVLQKNRERPPRPPTKGDDAP